MKRAREGTCSPADAELSEDEEEAWKEDEESRPLAAPEAVPALLRQWAKALVRPDVGWCKSVSEGVWLPEKQLCQVKVHKGNDMKTAGFSKEGGLYLYPEEALYLLERGKLVMENYTPQQLYEFMDLSYYLVYAYLKRTSLIVFRPRKSCPAPVAFEVYSPNSNFCKRDPGAVLFYVIIGRTSESLPTESEWCKVFAWADSTPIKFAMVSDEGAVFPVSLSHAELDNNNR